MKFTAVNLKKFFIFFCEFFGVAALYFAPEIQKNFLLGIALIGFIASKFFKISDRLIFILMAAVVMGGIAMGVFSKQNLVALTSISALTIHALLWFSKDEKRYNYWRIGIALLEIILAAILSIQAYMFFVIFLFMMACSLALSFSFLENNFERYDPEMSLRPIRKSFVTAVFSFSLLIFLLGLFLFPILPRSNWAMQISPQTYTGYTEVVSFKEATLSWGKGDTRTLMWLFVDNKSVSFPFGLIRGKTLDSFDGVEWRSGGRQVLPASEHDGQGVKIDIIRDPMSTDVLPLPYGASDPVINGREIPRQYISGEWVVRSKISSKVEYSTNLNGQVKFSRLDIPRAIHLKIPEISSKKIDELALRLKGNGTDLDRVKRVEQFFIKGKFESQLGEVNAVVEGKTHPIETFLFDTKKGHCELFSTAAALLFRKMGMPSRVVVGFRIPAKKNGGVISIKNTDAHAWIEVWATGRGWVPLDFTPPNPNIGVMYEGFQDALDFVSAYWNRNILSYEFETSFFRDALTMLKKYSLPTLGLVLALLMINFLSKAWQAQQRKRLPRNRAQQIFSSIQDLEIPKDKYEKIKKDFYLLRFGKDEPTDDELDKFYYQVRELKSAAAQESER